MKKSAMTGIKGSDLAQIGAGTISFVQGNPETFIERIAEPSNAGKANLIFVSDPKDVEPALQKGSAIVAAEKLQPENWKLPRPQDQILFKTANVRKAMAVIFPSFNRVGTPSDLGIHPSAVIHSSAHIGKNCVIEALAVIGANVTVGEGAWIQSGAIIESESKIGANTRIQSRAVIGSHCEIGAHCQIGPGTVIGSDGFGFIESQSQAPEKIPQIGRVVIGDSVEFGANCAVDRAAIGVTSIGSGSKFDNLCHVAHNCVIGKNCLFAGGFFVAGSSKIGDHFMCGGGVVVADHVEITHHVMLGGRATVTKDITESGAYTGYPLEKLKDGLRTIASLPQVKELREEVNEIKKKLLDR